MSLIVISEAVVRRVVTLDLAFSAVADALTAVAADEARILPVIFAEAAQPGAMFGVKTATHLAADLLGFKVGSYFPANRENGIPSHGSTTILLDAETGIPRALVSAGYLNGLRTAAANAVAVDRLAREDAATLGVIGAGHQAEFEVRAVVDRRPIETVKVWSRSDASVAGLCDRLADLDIRVTGVNEARDAVVDSDIVTTVTASREPLVDASWVSPGTHVSAMGADGAGKQELDPKLVAGSSRFADLPAQSVSCGEFQHAAAAGLIDVASIVPIGAVVLAGHPGRQTQEEITVFDSSGIATQDLHVAAAVVREALDQGIAETIEF